MRAILNLLAALTLSTQALAQAQMSQLPTLNQSIHITTGGTFQAIASGGQPMRSLTIQNNNTTATDHCWIEITGAVVAGNTLSTVVTIPGQSASTAQGVSILLNSGMSYGRYAPHGPTGPIVGTCTTTGDSLYVDWQ